MQIRKTLKKVIFIPRWQEIAANKILSNVGWTKKKYFEQSVQIKTSKGSFKSLNPSTHCTVH